MKSPSPAHRLGKAFTLIELLVVISIIAVLAGLLLPVVSSVMTNAKKTAAKNTETQIVTAVKAFKTEYGTYPMPADAPVSQEVCFGTDAPKAAELYDILQASEAQASSQGLPQATVPVNSRGIVYLQLPLAKNQNLPKEGIKAADGMLYDPWGTIYLVGIDGGYTGYTNNPYSKGAGSVPLALGVIVYSWGPDKLTSGNFFGGGGAGAKTDPTSVDDVVSWQ